MKIKEFKKKGRIMDGYEPITSGGRQGILRKVYLKKPGQSHWVHSFGALCFELSIESAIELIQIEDPQNVKYRHKTLSFKYEGFEGEEDEFFTILVQTTKFVVFKHEEDGFSPIAESHTEISINQALETGERTLQELGEIEGHVYHQIKPAETLWLSIKETDLSEGVPFIPIGFSLIWDFRMSLFPLLIINFMGYAITIGPHTE